MIRVFPQSADSVRWRGMKLVEIDCGPLNIAFTEFEIIRDLDQRIHLRDDGEYKDGKHFLRWPATCVSSIDIKKNP